MQAISATFAAFGKPAIVQEAPLRPIRVIHSQPDDIERFESRSIVRNSLILEIRATDMAGISEGVRIETAGRMREVRGVPEYRDADRLVAHVNTVPVTA